MLQIGYRLGDIDCTAFFQFAGSGKAEGHAYAGKAQLFSADDVIFAVANHQKLFGRGMLQLAQRLGNDLLLLHAAAVQIAAQNDLKYWSKANFCKICSTKTVGLEEATAKIFP